MPSIIENSLLTPAIRTPVIATPLKSANKTRLKTVPIVIL